MLANQAASTTARTLDTFGCRRDDHRCQLDAGVPPLASRSASDAETCTFRRVPSSNVTTIGTGSLLPASSCPERSESTAATQHSDGRQAALPTERLPPAGARVSLSVTSQDDRDAPPASRFIALLRARSPRRASHCRQPRLPRRSACPLTSSPSTSPLSCGWFGVAARSWSRCASSRLAVKSCHGF